MTYRSIDLTAELRSVPDADPPPTALDLAVARTRGAALRRRRRVAGAGTGFAAAGLAAALIFALVPDFPSAPPSEPAAPLVPPAGVAGAAGAAGQDPLTTTLSFGWLPQGLHMSGASYQNDESFIVASDGTTEFDATVLPPGQRPPNTCAQTLASVAPSRGVGKNPPSSGIVQTPCNPTAPDVDGHPALWSPAPGAGAAGTGYVQLDWEYAPNTWAYLTANIGKDTSGDIVGTVYKVAEAIRFGPAQRIPLPFHIPVLPQGMKALLVLWQGAPSAGRGVQPRNDWNGVNLSFGTAAPSASSPGMGLMTQLSTATFPTASELAETSEEPWPAKDVEHTSVDGRQAIVINAVEGGQRVQILTVHDVDGVDVTLSLYNTPKDSYINTVGGIVGYYRSIGILGADPAHWTTDVIG